MLHMCGDNEAVFRRNYARVACYLALWFIPGSVLGSLCVTEKGSYRGSDGWREGAVAGEGYTAISVSKLMVVGIFDRHRWIYSKSLEGEILLAPCYVSYKIDNWCCDKCRLIFKKIIISDKRCSLSLNPPPSFSLSFLLPPSSLSSSLHLLFLPPLSLCLSIFSVSLSSPFSLYFSPLSFSISLSLTLSSSPCPLLHIPYTRFSKKF